MTSSLSHFFGDGGRARQWGEFLYARSMTSRHRTAAGVIKVAVGGGGSYVYIAARDLTLSPPFRPPAHRSWAAWLLGETTRRLLLEEERRVGEWINKRRCVCMCDD